MTLPKLYHYKTERNADILSALKSGLTYADVGRKFHITRQRIHQIAIREEFEYSIDMEKYMTIAEAATLLNCTKIGMYKAIKSGKIKSIRIGQKYYIPKENPLIILCPICQNPVPMGRKKYCSVECYNKGQYKVMKIYQWRRLYKKQGKALPASLR